MSTMKFVQHWWKKLKQTHKNGKASFVHGLDEVTLLKYSRNPKQSVVSVESLWKYPYILHRARKKNPQIQNKSYRHKNSD
jgi:hypothetical protein